MGNPEKGFWSSNAERVRNVAAVVAVITGVFGYLGVATLSAITAVLVHAGSNVGRK